MPMKDRAGLGSDLTRKPSVVVEPGPGLAADGGTLFIKQAGSAKHNCSMNEIELKFQVPAARRAQVDAAVAGRAPQRRVRLQAVYVDTPERLLAQAGLALRVRREGREWVQTLKGPTDDGISRAEHNVGLGNATEVPLADPARHRGTAVGERLLKLLAAQPGAVLGPLYRTDILRRSRLQRVNGAPRPPHGDRPPRGSTNSGAAHRFVGSGSVELAFDEGRILAGDAHIAVCELEIELVAGSPLAVIDTARGWVARYGVWLDTRSKAERGDLLARGEAEAPARGAAPVELDPGLSLHQAWLRVLRSCAEQVSVNASQVASGEHGDEHVHQLRVGLRRLRSAMRLFEFGGEPMLPGDVGEAAASLFRRLGGARDQVAIQGAFAADLTAALHSAGVQGEMPPALADADAQSATDVLRSAASQAFLLDLLAGAHAGAHAEAPVGDVGDGAASLELKAMLARRLKRWHRQATRDAQGYAELDDEGRHRLRKRIKRLRYAVEFAGSLFSRAAVRRYLRALRALQDRLGAINDAVVGIGAFNAARDSDPRAWFAVGWLAARRDVLVTDAKPELRRFAKARGFWKDK